MSDVLCTNLFTRGSLSASSSHKVGQPGRSLGELTAAELRAYARPLFDSVTRCYPDVRLVVFYDDLPADFLRDAGRQITFVRTEHWDEVNVYDRRWYVLETWLREHAEVRRLLFLDCNDIALVQHPFRWWDALELPPNRLLVGEEWTPMRQNTWMQNGLKQCPAAYGDLMLGPHLDRAPLNVGAWGGHRQAVLELLTALTQELRRLNEHRRGQPAAPVEMFAFNYLLLDRQVHAFRMSGRGAAPLVHSRALALAHVDAQPSARHSRPRVLFAGCWGYGNAGDDLYRTLWPALLPDVECLMDGPEVHLDAWGDVSAVVIGGGGVVNSISADHERRLLAYVDFAREKRLPLAFASVGAMPVTVDPVAELAGWRRALEYATAITVRSPQDGALLRAIAPTAKVTYAPDLAYLVEPTAGRIIPPGRTVIVPYCGADWNGLEVLRARPAKSVLLCLSQNDRPMCQALGGEVLDGLSAAEAAAVCRDAAAVWTGRYHGLVLARAGGQTNIRVPRSTWKLNHEPQNWSKQEALRSVAAIQAQLRKAR